MSQFTARFLLLTSMCVSAFGQQYPFIAVPGSPKSVSVLFQDSEGRLWLGGSEPAVFDGARFFYLRDYGLPPGEATNFGDDPTGVVWIASNNGLYRFSNGRAEQVLKAYVGSVIAATGDAVVAEGGRVEQGLPTSSSLFRIQRSANGWRAEKVMNLNSPGPITLDQHGMLLYPVYGQGWAELPLAEILRWNSGPAPVSILHPESGFPGNGPMKVMRDRSGCLWIGAEGGNVYNCGQGVHNALYTGAFAEPRMRQAADGTMVLSGNSLLAVGKPGAFQVSGPENGLPGISDALPAGDGTIWLAGQGLFRFTSPFRIEYWTSREGVAEPPWSLARSGDRVYAGLGTRIVVLNGNRSHWKTLTSSVGRDLVSGLLGMEDKTVLASFRAGSAALFSPDGRVIAQNNKDHPIPGAMRVAGTPNGEWWLGANTLGQLTRIGSRLDFKVHPLRTQPSLSVLAVKYEEHTRKLSACYNGGFIQRDEHGIWKEFGTTDGLLAGGCWSIAPLPNGDVWYTYFGQKAMALMRPTPDGGINIRNYRASDGVPEPGGVTIDADQRGWLWRAGELGGYVATAQQPEKGQWLMFDRSDGFPANGMNSGSVFVDKDSSLWFGADNDLVHYNPPPDLVNPKFAPQVFVSAFSWDRSGPRLAEAVGGLPYKSKAVAHLGALQFERRNGLRVRYRILPEQPAWHESDSLDVALETAGTGLHSLQVQGRLFARPWSSTVSQSFTILTPAWRAHGLGSRFMLSAVACSSAAAIGGADSSFLVRPPPYSLILLPGV